MPLPTQLADAVRVIGERDSWRLRELPENVCRLELLKGLDQRGLVEVHLWDYELVPGGRQEIRRCCFYREGWFSPMRRPLRAGSWEEMLRDYTGDRSPEIQLTEKGREQFDGLSGGHDNRKKRGRPRKTRPDKIDLVVVQIVKRGEHEMDHPAKWKSLVNQYENQLPETCTPDALRKRVARYVKRPTNGR